MSEKISRGGNACNICNIDFVKKLAEGVMHVIYVIWISLKKSAEEVMHVIYVISILLKKSAEGVMRVIYVISMFVLIQQRG